MGYLSINYGTVVNPNLNLFVYGSLQYEPVWSRLIQQPYAQYPALLKGYRRLKVREEDYPGLIPAQDQDQVTGHVRLQLTPHDLQRLDQFEGEYYARFPVTVQRLDAPTIWLPAEVYVFKPDHWHRLSDHPWDAEEFAAQGLQRFIRDYAGFF